MVFSSPFGGLESHDILFAMFCTPAGLIYGGDIRAGQVHGGCMSPPLPVLVFQRNAESRERRLSRQQFHQSHGTQAAAKAYHRDDGMPGVPQVNA
jgi:hypothetical protein